MFQPVEGTTTRERYVLDSGRTAPCSVLLVRIRSRWTTPSRLPCIHKGARGCATLESVRRKQWACKAIAGHLLARPLGTGRSKQHFPTLKGALFAETSAACQQWCTIFAPHFAESYVETNLGACRDLLCAIVADGCFTQHHEVVTLGLNQLIADSARPR